MENLTEYLVLGVPISIVAPIAVQRLVDMGMSKKWTFPASTLTCLCLIALSQVAGGAIFAPATAAQIILQAVIYGVAGNGVYSQIKLFSEAK